MKKKKLKKKGRPKKYKTLRTPYTIRESKRVMAKLMKRFKGGKQTVWDALVKKELKKWNAF